MIRIPGNKALLVIDAKFPLEGFEAAARRGHRRRKKSRARRGCAATSASMSRDIAEKYLIPGEVQTPAIMFVPSESHLCRPA